METKRMSKNAAINLVLFTALLFEVVSCGYSSRRGYYYYWKEGNIAGLVIGCILLVLCFSGMVYYCCKAIKERKAKQAGTAATTPSTDPNVAVYRKENDETNQTGQDSKVQGHPPPYTVHDTSDHVTHDEARLVEKRGKEK